MNHVLHVLRNTEADVNNSEKGLDTSGTTLAAGEQSSSGNNSNVIADRGVTQETGK